ncbi:MAG: hypothetical protein CTY15_06690 [Methylocystis sp.]|nr:MAG: hypothetical protein CTY15_06690 [Methylocystis sp.]
MGEVIAFQTRAKPARPASVAPTGDAQILFFLGVRYERAGDASGSGATLSPDHGHGPRGGKKRKSRARA